MELELANHYANALFSLAKEEDKVLLYQDEVKELQKIICDNPDFLTLLDARFLTIKEREEECQKILKGFNQDIISWLRIIIKHNRVKILSDILKAFNSLCNDDRDIKEGILYTAYPLSEEMQKQITLKIAQLENCAVELIPHIDPTLIGGVKIAINSHIYDGSIKNQLEKMKIDLLRKEL